MFNIMSSLLSVGLHRGDFNGSLKWLKYKKRDFLLKFTIDNYKGS